MSDIVPHGLIRIVSTQVPEAPSIDLADAVYERVQILRQFWKVHAVKYKVSCNSTDLRCENLFWRTWGSPRLAHSLAASTLTTLWSRCHKEDALVPFSRLFEKGGQRGSHLDQVGNNEDEYRATAAAYQKRDPPSLITQTVASQRPENINRMPTSSLSSDAEFRKELSPSVAPLTTRQQSSRGATSRGVPNTRRRGVMRPSMSRRKSSQTTASTSQVHTPHIGSQSTFQTRLKPSAAPTSDVRATISRGSVQGSLEDLNPSAFEIPSTSSWEDEPPNENENIGHQYSARASQENSFVIDRDFRSKFADRIASSSNIASMDRVRKIGSVVRFVNDVDPDAASGTGISSLEINKNDIRREASRRGSHASIAVSDSDEEEESARPHSRSSMPRTTSHLSLMISERRAMLGENSLPESTAIRFKRTTENKDKHDDVNEDDLLAMGRREGVTRAGGIQGRHVFQTPGGSRYSSPSPEPLF